LGPVNSLEANACEHVPPLELVQDSDDSCIKKELKGAQDVQYEPRGDIPGVG